MHAGMEVSKVPKAEAFPKCNTDADCEYMQPVCRVIAKIAKCVVSTHICECQYAPPPPHSPPSRPPPPPPHPHYHN